MKNENTISLLVLNIRADKNKEYERVKQFIKHTDADIVGVIELNKQWIREILTLDTKYNFVFTEEHYGGLMILSKYPILSPTIQTTNGQKRPRVAAKVKKLRKTFSITLVHSVSPKHDLKFRKEELSIIAKESRAASRPFILFGDLNCSPFSFYFDNILEIGNLRDTEAGFGFQGTWPATIIPLIPVDHVLSSADLKCRKRLVGPNIGSDHLPIFVELVLTE